MNQYLGQEVEKLGFGMMRLPRQGDVIDIEHTKKMVDQYLEAGFHYIDTAWIYEGSEEATKAALVDRYPRDQYILATKLPAWDAKSAEEAREMFNTSLVRTGAGYFDYYLLHNLGENRTKCFDDYDLWSFLEKKKEEGLIKHLGFSFHDKADVLDKILTEHPEMEFVQLQINYVDWESDSVESRKCYEVARKHNKPIIIMEPIKGGKLANPPKEVADIFKQADANASPSSWAIRFAASLEGVITVLSGMSTIQQMEDNISYMKEFKPLTGEEYQVIEKARECFASFPTVPCTSCAYCIKECPKSIAIYGTFEAVNVERVYGDLASAKDKYSWNTKERAKASECIECGKCEEVCPQHIHIREELKKAVELLEA